MEYSAIEDPAEDDLVIEENQNGFWKYLVVLSILVVGSVAILNFNLQARSNTLKTSAFEGTGVLTWTLNRDGYEPLSMFTSSAISTLSYAFLSKKYGIVEPYAPMMLYAEDYDEDDTSYFEFVVCSSSDSSYCETGVLSNDDDKYTTVTLKCSPFEEFSVSISKYSAAGTKLGKSGGTVICMYVRRELRDLTTTDLTATMDAMYTLWNTTEEEGQALYGENFHNSTYFVEAHHFNSAWKDSDHIHEGLGFLTQHIKITNIFELSMQSVDPSVSLPYWDFTVDSANGDDVFSSYAFQYKTFGSLTAPADPKWGWTYRNDSIKSSRIRNGRWKHLKADYNIKYDQLYSNFGYLRAPWNTNPNPYISRFSAYTTQLPECSDHYRLLEYSTLNDFLSQSPYSPHASMHGAIGSVYGCDLMDPLRDAGLILSDTEQNLLCQKWGFMLKELYRKNFLVANDDCSYTTLDYDGVDCSISCLTEKYDNMGLQMSQLISTSYVGTLTNNQWNEWRDFVCYGDGTKIFVGDHLESASPADPSFWPIHPTLERLLQAKRMSGTFKSTEWSSDGDSVCDKSQCYEGGEYGTYVACCYGHNEDDQLLDFVNADKNSGYGPTNAEILADTDPTSENYVVTYVYGDFEWSHCSEDFTGLLTGTLTTNSAASPAKVSSTSTNTATTNTATTNNKKSDTSSTSTTRSSSSSSTSTTADAAGTTSETNTHASTTAGTSSTATTSVTASVSTSGTNTQASTTTGTSSKASGTAGTGAKASTTTGTTSKASTTSGTAKSSGATTSSKPATSASTSTVSGFKSPR